ncbi:MAG: hypothetical protein P4M14_07945 [Gammaproteobacteria bacterium]|nr:hypothetical protein [Gammaproteobacteria bacterium]
MTDNLLEKVEEKVIALLTELEQQRKENNFLKNENAQLKTEKTQQTTRLQGLVSLLNVLDPADNVRAEHLAGVVQGEAVSA